MASSRSFQAFALGAITIAGALLGCLLAIDPLRVVLPREGLDPSWVMVAGEAAGWGLVSGDDVTGTVGPLSSVYTGYLDPDLFWFKFGARLLVAVSLASLIVLLAFDSRRPAAALFFGATIAIFQLGNDALVLAVPMLTALVAISESRSQTYALLFGLPGTIIASLGKFTVPIFALPAFLLVDLVQVLRRRPPIFLLSYSIATVAVFCLVAGADSLIPSIVNSFSVASGYSDAMSIALGSTTETFYFLLFAFALFGLIAANEWQAVMSRRRTWPSAVALILILAAYLFLLWKDGFVRHDLHSLNAWYGLVITCLTYLLVAPSRVGSGRFAIASCGVAAYGILLVVIPSVKADGGYGPPPPFLSVAKARVAEARAFFSGPGDWLAQHLLKKQNALADIKRQSPLPELDGTVDVIPSMQSTVIANGLSYHPRPSFQENGTYTKRLIELNRRFLLERGPDYLLFRPGSIDGRHPAQAEGPLWPDILRLYDPASLADNLLVLQRRSTPIAESILGPEQRVDARFGEAIATPSIQEPQFMTATIRKTWLGHLASLLFRPSLIFIEVTYTNGRTERYRLIPAIAEAGFLISPTIKTAADFAQVASGRGGDPLPAVAQVKFTSGSLGAWLYHQDIDVAFRPVLSQLLLARALPPELEQYTQAISILHAFYKSAPETPLVAFVSEGLLVHAPVAVSVELEHPVSGIELRYGINDRAWQANPGTDGACFKMSAKDAVLFERCLDPRVETSDRGEQRAHIPIDLQAGDKVSIETSCLKRCEYDWTYLSGVQFNSVER